jgi:hypothetical protein
VSGVASERMMIPSLASQVQYVQRRPHHCSTSAPGCQPMGRQFPKKTGY